MSAKSAILNEIERLTKELSSLPEISAENRKRLDDKFRLEFHFNSNHIEGNTLTYSETELLIIFDETRGGHTLREYEEMKASDVALEMVKDIAENKTPPLTESFIKNLNTVLLVRPYWKDAITPDGAATKRKITIGDYKNHPNSVRLANGEIFNYASPQSTPSLMGDLIAWFRQHLEAKDLHPVELAAQLHYKFVIIHPFDDGNGRISRLLMNYVLYYFNFPPVIIKTDDKANYLRALRDADTGNLDSFIEYIAKQLLWSLEISIKATKGETIEEKLDWKKDLNLLKRDLSIHEEIKQRKSVEAVLNVVNNGVFPAITATFNGLQELRELFLKSNIIVSANTPEGSFFEFKEGYMIPSQEGKRFLKGLELRYYFEDFTRNGTDVFTVSITLKVRFDDFSYTVILYEKDILTKFYHQLLSQEDIDEIINEIGKLVVVSIRAGLKQQS